MHVRGLLFSAILLSIGVSCINAFLFPVHHKQVLAASRLATPNFTLSAQMNDNDNQNGVSESDNFDAAGFGNYLAPYLIAFLVSIGITGAFVKFVLMDY
mmetsp:Transcript_22102/g.36366  ORF Transcript_22102/g.36366 Transcript_22102/m.36366 type:complete len:99 (+) Transcript_22102:90-386(+)|eukprot:scaffold91_cov143-Skeletonema_menzelii.AAC.25